MPNRYSIVAMKPLGTEEVVGALQPGAAVTLVREPTNKFDANAVMVWVDGKHVGYIPKATNKTLAQFIDANGRDQGISLPPIAQDSKPALPVKAIMLIRFPHTNGETY